MSKNSSTRSMWSVHSILDQGMSEEDAAHVISELNAGRDVSEQLSKDFSEIDSFGRVW